MPAMCGKHSETWAPLRPWRLNLRRVASSLGTSLANVSMNAKRLPLRYESGIGLPLSSCSFGL